MILASYSGCNTESVVILFTTSMGLMGAFYPGMKVNALDLSGNFAGTIMAIVNGIGAITGIIAPYLVGLLTPDVSVINDVLYKLSNFKKHMPILNGVHLFLAISHFGWYGARSLKILLYNMVLEYFLNHFVMNIKTNS